MRQKRITKEGTPVQHMASCANGETGNDSRRKRKNSTDPNALYDFGLIMEIVRKDFNPTDIPRGRMLTGII